MSLLTSVHYSKGGVPSFNLSNHWFPVTATCSIKPEGITQGMRSSRGHGFNSKSCLSPYEKYPKPNQTVMMRWLGENQSKSKFWLSSQCSFILFQDGNIEAPSPSNNVITTSMEISAPPTPLPSERYLAPNMDRFRLSSLQIQNFCLNVPIIANKF